MRSRSRLEICIDIMREVTKSREVASVARRVQLPLRDAEEQLSFLSSQGFVRTLERDAGTEYRLTEKGFQALKAYEGLMRSGRSSIKQTVNPKVVQ